MSIIKDCLNCEDTERGVCVECYELSGDEEKDELLESVRREARRVNNFGILVLLFVCVVMVYVTMCGGY